MFQQSYSYRCNQGEQSDSKELQLAFLASGKGLFDLSLLKILQLRSQPESCSAAICEGGVSSADASTLVDIKSSDFGVMDAATLSSGSGSRPGVNLELRSLDSQSPSSIDEQDISPTNRVFVQGVDDNHSFIAKNYFGANQVEINRDEREERNQHICSLRSGARVIEVRPGEKSADYCSEERKIEVGARTEDLSVIHSTILSQITTITSDTIKAVS